MIASLPPVISQKTLNGAGDWDECGMAATIWAAHAVDPSIKVPTVAAFRAADQYNRWFG